MVIKMKYDVYVNDVLMATMEIVELYSDTEKMLEETFNVGNIRLVEWVDGVDPKTETVQNKNEMDIELDIMTDREGTTFEEIAYFVDRVRKENQGVSDENIHMERAWEQCDHEQVVFVVPSVNSRR